MAVHLLPFPACTEVRPEALVFCLAFLFSSANFLHQGSFIRRVWSHAGAAHLQRKRRGGVCKRALRTSRVKGIGRRRGGEDREGEGQMDGKSEIALHSHEPKMRGTTTCSRARVAPAGEPQEGGGHGQRHVPAEGSVAVRGCAEWTRALGGF